MLLLLWYYEPLQAPLYVGGTHTNLQCHIYPQEALDRALSLAHEGDGLIQNSHYAEDTILPKCGELRSVSEDLSNNLKARKEHLLKAMELHHSLERVRKEHTQCTVVSTLFLTASNPPTGFKVV